MRPDVPRSTASAILLELALYLPIAIALTWPLLLHPASRLTAPITEGDPYLNLWILGWDLRTLTVHPLAFLSGRVFDANIFYPATNTLAYSDNFLLQAVALWPVYVITRNVVLVYNVLLFGSFLANGMAMHLLVRALTGSRWSGWVAGLVWAFWPYHYSHLLQLQLQALYFLPLAFLFLHRLSVGYRRADALALGICAAAQTISAAYYGVMTVLALAVAGVVLIASARNRRMLLIRRLALSATIATICVAPFVWPYWRLQLDGFVRTLYEAGEHGALLQSYAWVPETNILHRLIHMPSGPMATDTFERQLFPGLTVVLLAAAGLLAARRRQFPSLFGAMPLLILLGVVLSLGPEGVRWFYTLTHRYLFGFQAIRVPARFGVLVTFGLATLAGFGIRDLLDRLRRRWPNATLSPVLLGTACVVCVIGESVNLPLPSVPAPPVHTAVGQWLARASTPGAVLYLPLYPDKRNTPVMVASLEHGRPIVNGHSGSRPPFFLALVETLQQFPSAESLRTLHDLDVRYVVSPKPVGVIPAAFVERARFGDGVIYELLWSLETAAVLAPADSRPPPERGRLSFEHNESASYAITWETAPGGFHVTAAMLTIAATAAPPVSAPPCTTRGNRDGAAGGDFPAPLHGGIHMTGFVQTASWVSRFFQAQDCFNTWTDDALMPLVTGQERREGRRLVEQIAQYDAARHSVRLQHQITLPISVGSRDALSALFYARTLPLKPGDVVDIPVNENGRNIDVHMKVAGDETLQLAGKSITAVRVEPTLHYRVETRRPIQITLWLSHDDRHLPLVMAFHTDFGSFRAELQSYRSN